MTNTFKKTCILFLSLFLGLNGNIMAQEDDLVFKYLEEKVSRIRMSRVEYIDMTYEGGLIIGKEYRNGPLVERRFYYAEPGKLDSMIFHWERGGEYFSVGKYYHYNPGGRLAKVKTFIGPDHERFDLDYYRYNETGRLDSIIRWQNYSQGPFGGISMVDLEPVTICTMSYDTLGRLIRVENSLDVGKSHLVEYLYKTDGRIGVAIEQWGNGYNDRFTVTRHRYNDIGLLIKEVSSLYNTNAYLEVTGRIYRHTQRYKYEYYE